LKASVASRTLDNITGVLISFKNFRKTLKNEMATGEPPKNMAVKTPEMYRQSNLNLLLSLPNGDLTWEDVEKPQASADQNKSDNSFVEQQKHAGQGRVGSSQNKINSGKDSS
jgi:hypothetical protein